MRSWLPERGAGGGGGGAGRADRGAAARGRGAAPAGGPGFLGFLPAPSQDGPAARAKKRAGRRVRPGRAQGGQKGHPGATLAWAARPDETRVLEPGACGGCGADLADAPGRVVSAVQVLDIPPAALAETEDRMMRRTCVCGEVTTAAPPPGVTGGPVCYGPNVVDAATLLASTDVIGIERAADLMGALLRAPVSTGFVSRCLVRLDAALTAAGFEDALKDALWAADVLGTDETPAPLTSAVTSTEGCGEPARLHGADHARLHRRRAGPDLVRRGGQPYQGGDHRVRDPGRLPRVPGPRRLRRLPHYDSGLAGVQQCLAHMRRYLGDAYATDLQSQA
jgi:hypothetical protein